MAERRRSYYYPHSTVDETEISQHPQNITQAVWMQSSHILSFAGTLHVKSCSNKRLLGAWKQSKGKILLANGIYRDAPIW